MPSGGLAGTATNTLQGEDVLGMLEAAAQEQAQALAQRTQQTGEAAQQAQGQYQQAAQAPQEVPNDFVQNLFSNLASVVSQQPSYRENQQQVAAQHKADLLKKRADNLQALHDIYGQKADEAQRAGDLETTEKYRVKREALHDKLETVNQAAARAERANQAALDRASAERIAGSRAASGVNTARMGTEEGLNDAADSVVAGETQITDYPIYQRPQINTIIRQSGRKITPKKVRDTIQGLSAARGVIANLRDLSGKINVGDARSQLLIGAKRAAGAKSRLDEDAALYDDARNGFLATLSRSTGERGVLTDQDVARAKRLLPRFIDSKSLAVKKFDQLQGFLDSIEQRTKTTYMEPNAGTGAAAAPPPTGDPLGIR